MKTGIHIGNMVDAKATVEPLAAAIVTVLEAIAEHGHDRETGIKALDLLSLGGHVAPTTVSHCTISGSDGRGAYVGDSDD